MSPDALRVAFEAWYDDGPLSARALERGADGCYLYTGAASAWTAWQACAMACAAAAEEAEEEQAYYAWQDAEAATNALDWYARIAKQMQQATLRLDGKRTLDLMQELVLDGGKRAREILGRDAT